jgi:hypothetical protein
VTEVVVDRVAGLGASELEPFATPALNHIRPEFKVVALRQIRPEPPLKFAHEGLGYEETSPKPFVREFYQSIRLRDLRCATYSKNF